MTKITKNKWLCIVCGSSSNDIDEKNNSLENHVLKQHNLSIKKYEEMKKDGIGCSKLKVKLLNYPNDIKLPLVSFLSQTWGPTFNLDSYTSDEITNMISLALNGKTLPTALECLNFTFQIDGLSRASSHQLVRVRIGSGFSQKGMSDAYYGDVDYIIPASIVASGNLDIYRQSMEGARKAYIQMFKSGVVYQDARFILSHCVTTSLVWTVNFLALKNFCNKRLMRNQSWEMNALCQLIKFELEKVYPELAKVLVPACDYSKKCCSFGNLFEGCGKYPLEKSHNRYVFSSCQIARNIKFTDEYRKNTIRHNKNVKKVNNHFLLLAQEQNNIRSEFYGKYAHQIFLQLNKIKIEKIDDVKKNIFEILKEFSELYSEFEKFENTNNDETFRKYANNKDLLKYQNNLASISSYLFDKNKNEIINECWYLHQSKNKKYNDGWYYDGIRGVMKDLHRKNQRIKTSYESNKIYNLNENDLYDTLLYVIFLIVSLECNIPYKGE